MILTLNNKDEQIYCMIRLRCELKSLEAVQTLLTIDKFTCHIVIPFNTEI